MSKVLTMGAVAVLVGLGGCTQAFQQSAALPPGTAPNSSAASWQMPWQLSPMTLTSAAQEGEAEMAFVPQTGMVRATPTAMARIGKPLEAYAGLNRTVEPCREVVRSEASKIGAKDVEAVAAGPEKRDRKGEYFGPVLMRVTYDRGGGWYEVREATMTCIVTPKGKIVDAYT